MIGKKRQNRVEIVSILKVSIFCLLKAEESLVDMEKEYRGLKIA